MNYATVRDLSLQLMNQYSIAGERIGSEYNNQDDYLRRIPGLVNDALVYIATTAKRIFAETQLVGRPFGQYRKYALPADLFDIRRVFGMRGGSVHGIADYTRLGSSLLIPDEYTEVYLDYCRYPRLLNTPKTAGSDMTTLPRDADVLDAAEDAAAAIPYYVAAHLCLTDDPRARDVLMDEFETKLIRLRGETSAQSESVSDVYGYPSVYGGVYL